MPAKRAQRRRPRSAFSRVVKVTSVKHFRDAVDKAAQRGRLLYALFVTAYNSSCAQMSMFLHDLSTRKDWLHVTFVEVNLQTAQDAVAELEVKGLPGVQCWKDGQCVQNTCYTSAAQVLASLKTYAGDPPAERSCIPGWLAMPLRAAMVGAVAAAGWWLYQTHGRTPALTGAAAELAQIDADIRKAQSSIHHMRRQRGKKKEVKATLAKLKELETKKKEVSKQAEVEDRRRQRQQAVKRGNLPVDGSDVGVDDEEEGDVEEVRLMEEEEDDDYLDLEGRDI